MSAGPKTAAVIACASALSALAVGCADGTGQTDPSPSPEPSISAELTGLSFRGRPVDDLACGPRADVASVPITDYFTAVAICDSSARAILTPSRRAADLLLGTVGAPLRETPSGTPICGVDVVPDQVFARTEAGWYLLDLPANDCGIVAHDVQRAVEAAINGARD